MSRITRSGRSSSVSVDRLLPVLGLPDDVVPLFLEHLREVEADQRLVLGDHDAGCTAGGGHGEEAIEDPGRSGIGYGLLRQPGWRNGIRDGLKHHCPKGLVGSNPTLGTPTRLVGGIARSCVHAAHPTAGDRRQRPGRVRRRNARCAERSAARRGRQDDPPVAAAVSAPGRGQGSTAPQAVCPRCDNGSLTTPRTPSCWAGTSATATSRRPGARSSTCTSTTTSTYPVLNLHIADLMQSGEARSSPAHARKARLPW